MVDLVEPFDYAHKSGNSGVTLDNAAEYTSSLAQTFNGGQHANVLRAVPRYVGVKGLRLGVLEWSVSSPGDADVRLGVYTATSTKNLYPAALVVDCGVQSMSTGGRKTWTADVTLAQGVVWFVWVASTANGQVMSVPNAPKSRAFTFLGKSGSTYYAGFTAPYTYGALPATFPAGGTLFTVNASPTIPFFYNDVF